MEIAIGKYVITDKQIMMSKATSIEELLKEIKDAKKFIQNEFKKARGEK